MRSRSCLFEAFVKLTILHVVHVDLVSFIALPILQPMAATEEHPFRILEKTLLNEHRTRPTTHLRYTRVAMSSPGPGPRRPKPNQILDHVTTG